MAEPVKIKFEYKNLNNVEAEVPGAQKLRAAVNDENGECEIMQQISHDDVNMTSTELHELEREGDEQINTNGEEIKEDDKKTRTKIPVSRFKQTADRVKAKRRGSKDKKEPESHIPVRRSSFPKQTANKAPAKPARKSIHVTTIELPKPTVQEDEFDKLYEEVVHSTPTPIDIEVSLLDPKIEDPEKLESKFEEIIHGYDENTAQPIDEKMKKSKIPFFKRRSQQEIEVVKKSGKMIAARDKLRMRHHSARSDDSNDAKVEETVSYITVDDRSDVEQNKEEIVELTYTVVDEKIYDTPSKLVETSYSETINVTPQYENGNDESRKVFSTTIVTKVASSESRQIKEENLCKDYIKVGIPVFDSYISESIEEVKVESAVEVTDKPYCTTNNDVVEPVKFEASIEVIEINNSPILLEVNGNTEQNVVEISETYFDIEPALAEIEQNIEDTMVVLKEEDNNLKDTAKLRGPYDNILISKTGTPEPVKAHEIAFGNDLPKKKSVLSKIAMFERNEVEPVINSRIPKKNTTLTITSNTQKIENVHIHTPLIVDEVFKPFQTKLDCNTSNNNVEKTNDDETHVVRAEMALVESPETVQYSIEDKVLIESNTMLIDQYSVAEEVLKPLPWKHEPKNKDEMTKIDKEYIIKDEATDIPAVPKITPVKKALKRYESLDGNEDHVNNKIIEDIPTAKMVLVESPETVQYSIEKKVEMESNTMFVKQTLVAEETSKPVPNKYEAKNKDETNKTDEERIFGDKSVDTSVVVPSYIPVKEALKRYESLNGHDSHVNNKTIEDLPKVRPISEIIKTLKPENKPRSLDTMFAHQLTPVSDILKDIKPEQKDNADKVYTTQKSHSNLSRSKIDLNNEEFPKYDKTKHGFKSFRSRGYNYATLENKDDNNFKTLQFIQDYNKAKNKELPRAKSVAELDIGDTVKGKVSRMIVRINSVERIELDTKEVPINLKERPMRRSVSEKIALFERKSTALKEVSPRIKQNSTEVVYKQEEITADIQAKIAELSTARLKYGRMASIPRVQLANGVSIPVIAIGTALLDPRLAYHIVTAAIDLGYRAIDTAFIYGNEKVVGEAINAKIKDGTVTREELFIISKLWSTFHRTDLVAGACEASLQAMGLDYFDLFLIHNPMSFKEGGSPLPKIATVLQYSESDYLDAWFGMETLGSRVRALGVSNFNSAQIKRVLDRARIKPVINQVECHPYLSQQKLDDYCNERNITLNCFGVLGSKGTPAELKSGQTSCIDDPLLQVMASGLSVSPAQLLIRYQLECGHTVVVKSSSAAHLWDNLQALTFNMTSGQIDALHALNRNKRTFTFKGMGDTHKNYPFKTLF